MDTLLRQLNAIHPLSAELQEYLKQILRRKELPRKAYLLRAGRVCRHIYFVEQGLLRCFYLKEDQEVCSWFMKEQDIIVSVESFFRQQESYESIQALEDCVLYGISYDELEHIFQTFPEFNFVGRMLLQHYYILSEQRLYSLRMQRSNERYEYLLHHHPELILRVPSKYLASYLSISEAHFSVIKGR